MKSFGWPFLILACASAASARAAELQALPLGAPLSSVQQAVAASGLSLVPAGAPDGPDRSVFLVPRDNPAQLEFCAGVLVRVTEAVPGGIAAFLARSEAASRQHGLSIPHLEALGDGEIAYSEWHLADGSSLTVAWTADRDGAIGSVTRDRPCLPGVAAPAAPPAAQVGVAAPAPTPAPTREVEVRVPLPDPPPAPGLQPAAPGVIAAPAAPPVPAPAAEVRVPLPDAPATLAVDALRPPPAKPAPAGKSRPEPVRVPPPPRSIAAQPAAPVPAPPAPVSPAPVPTASAPAVPADGSQPKKPAGEASVPLPPEAARSAAADAADPFSGPTSAGRRVPLPRPARVVRPKTPHVAEHRPGLAPPAAIRSVPAAGEPEDPADPSEPSSTNAIAPSGPLDLSIESGEPAPAAVRPPPPAPADRRASWRPASPAECAKAFRSYDPRTGLYRTLAGQMAPCP